MGEFESQPNSNISGDSSTETENALRVLTSELQNLQRNLLESLQADVSQLQSEKARLHDDIRRLRQERDALIGEQHALVRQLGQVLANHISSKLESSLETLFTVAMERIDARVPSVAPTPPPEIDVEGTLQPILQSFHQAIATTLTQIQADLDDYHSAFSQQLGQMQDEQTRGQAILSELVNRLRSELTTTSPPIHRVDIGGNDDDAPHVEFEETGIPPFNQFESGDEVLESSTSEYIPEREVVANEVTPLTPSELFSRPSPSATDENLPPQNSPMYVPRVEGEPSHPPTPPPKSQSGLMLVGLSAIFSALYHVAIKAVFNPRSQILGAFTLEQLMTPTLGNCLLILTLRMLVVVPLLLVLAPMMHIRVWHDLQVLFDSFKSPSQRRYPEANVNKRIVILSVVSGGFLFVSQALIYFAISQMPVGVSIALFFAYPIASGLLSWLLLQERFSRFRVTAIATICLGNLLVLTNLNTVASPGNITLGGLAAVFAGISFAINILFSRICATRVHAISYNLINFSTMLLLALASWLVSLPLTGGIQSNGTKLLEIVLSAFILGVLSVCGYILNYFGIRKLGPTAGAIAGATVPVLTVFFAGILIQEQLTLVQILGVLIVTLGVAGFSLEKIRHRLRHQRAIN